MVANSVKNHSLVASDATILPLKTNSFDLLMAFHVLEHIRDIKSLRREIHRILQPGGKMILCMPLGYDTDPCHRWHFMSKKGWSNFVKSKLGLTLIKERVEKKDPSEYLGVYMKPNSAKL